LSVWRRFINTITLINFSITLTPYTTTRPPTDHQTLSSPLGHKQQWLKVLFLDHGGSGGGGTLIKLKR